LRTYTGIPPRDEALGGIRQAKASKAENIVMFNYLFFMPSMHMLWYKATATLPFRDAGLALEFWSEE